MLCATMKEKRNLEGGAKNHRKTKRFCKKMASLADSVSALRSRLRARLSACAIGWLGIFQLPHRKHPSYLLPRMRRIARAFCAPSGKNSFFPSLLRAPAARGISPFAFGSSHASFSVRQGELSFPPLRLRRHDPLHRGRFFAVYYPQYISIPRNRSSGRYTPEMKCFIYIFAFTASTKRRNAASPASVFL